MTKEEKLSGNRLIGEFVGKSFSGSHITDYKGVSDAALPSMKYHSDFGWLMKAWYKFIDLRFHKPVDQFKHSDLKTTIGIAILYGGKELAFQNMVKGIKWYNETLCAQE